MKKLNNVPMFVALEAYLEHGPESINDKVLPFVESFIEDYVMPKYGSIRAYLIQHSSGVEA